jgi:hypothetical protein
MNPHRDGADRAFDGIVVELDATIVDKARQAFPTRQGVADTRRRATRAAKLNVNFGVSAHGQDRLYVVIS